MLSARKVHLLAGLKVSGLGLRTRELDFYLTRYIAIGAFSTMSTGMSYVGIIKIKIPVGEPSDSTRQPDETTYPYLRACYAQEYKQVGSEMFERGSWEVRKLAHLPRLCCLLAPPSLRLPLTCCRW